MWVIIRHDGQNDLITVTETQEQATEFLEKTLCMVKINHHKLGLVWARGIRAVRTSHYTVHELTSGKAIWLSLNEEQLKRIIG